MQHVLVGLDGSPEETAVLLEAVRWAGQTASKLTLLHVVDVPVDMPPPGSLLLKVPTSKSELVSAARQRLLLLMDDVPEAMRGDVVVETGNPATVLCKVAQSRAADLVVIGAHRHGLIRRMLGTTASQIVNNLDRPAFVVRTPGFVSEPAPSSGLATLRSGSEAGA